MYTSRKEAAAAEEKAKEAELIRLGLMSAKEPVEVDGEGSESEYKESVNIERSSAPALKGTTVVPFYEHMSYLWECQLSEVNNILDMWYDLLELREGRYRMKPERLLRIATCQNNIVMILIENYIHFRKSLTSQRRMTEVRSLFSFLIDTVS